MVLIPFLLIKLRFETNFQHRWNIKFLLPAGQVLRIHISAVPPLRHTRRGSRSCHLNSVRLLG